MDESLPTLKVSVRDALRTRLRGSTGTFEITQLMSDADAKRVSSQEPDLHNEIAATFGLRFELPDYLRALYKNVFKNDLAIVNGDSNWTLPMPARFLIGQDGTILYAEVNPDYTRRPDPQLLLRALGRVVAAAA